MSIRQIFAGIILAAVALPVAAQGIGGKWNASFDTPQGVQKAVFDFVVDGDELTGTITPETPQPGGPQEIAIAGTVDGNEVEFALNFEGGPGGGVPVTVNFTGMVEGDELTLTMNVEGAPQGGGPTEMTITATRAE